MLVGEFCNREVVVVDQETAVLNAVKLLRSEHVCDLVVVGIVTSDDLTELMAEQLNNLVLLVGNELFSERARRD